MKHLNHGLVDNCEITTACEIHIKIKVNIDVYVIKRVCVQIPSMNYLFSKLF